MRSAGLVRINDLIVTTTTKIGWLILGVGLALLAGGCAAPHPSVSETTDTSARFNEGAQANVIVDFNSWNYTYLNKPEVSDGPYRREVSTNEISLILEAQHVPRHLAVVKVSWLLKGEALRETVERWDTVLHQMKFDRVIFVRPANTPELSGALILHDSKSPQRLAFTSSLSELDDPRWKLTVR